MKSYLVIYSLLSKKMTLYRPNFFKDLIQEKKYKKLVSGKVFSDSSLKSRQFHSGVFSDE